MTWWRRSSRTKETLESFELFIKYPWWASFFLSWFLFFAFAVARPLGWMDKGHRQASLTMERTPEAFWSIAASCAVLFLVVGLIFHVVRARQLAAQALLPKPPTPVVTRQIRRYEAAKSRRTSNRG